MTDEPYRWLEAIANRREYIRDQLKGASPVFAFSRPEGVLLLAVGVGQSKVFEVYDRHGLAALGHPVDIEKSRQVVIEAAHMEGFARAASDVTMRRLITASLGPLLKNAFEQIFTAPLIVESILAEVGATSAQDQLARVSYDGTPRYIKDGIAVAHVNPAHEATAAQWLAARIQPDTSLADVARLALQAERELAVAKPFAEAPPAAALPADGRVLEAALLDRRATGRVRYRPLSAEGLGL
jgi:proteasome alpha subunit